MKSSMITAAGIITEWTPECCAAVLPSRSTSSGERGSHRAGEVEAQHAQKAQVFQGPSVRFYKQQAVAGEEETSVGVPASCAGTSGDVAFCHPH